MVARTISLPKLLRSVRAGNGTGHGAQVREETARRHDVVCVVGAGAGATAPVTVNSEAQVLVAPSCQQEVE